MPDSTAITPSRLAAKRMAHEAQEAWASAFLNTRSTDSGGLAKRPPLTGSMMTTGFPCFLAVS